MNPSTPSQFEDDDLTYFEETGTPSLPPGKPQGHISLSGAHIFYSLHSSSTSWNTNPTVTFLHGGLGHSGDWAHQMPTILSSNYNVLLIDTRGHGRSTHSSQSFSYELLASDVLAVLDHLVIAKTALVGWSDGAVTALTVAKRYPERVAGVFFFACNMDPSGTKDFEMTPVVQRCYNRHVKNYKELSATPEKFNEFRIAVSEMQETQPNWTVEDLEGVDAKVWVVQGVADEFIRMEHADYLAKNIPHAKLTVLEGVTHFAPLQRPGMFNGVLLEFLGSVFGQT
jgi:pimeloyl-ACP methyl ester carboxylesterase